MQVWQVLGTVAVTAVTTYCCTTWFQTVPHTGYGQKQSTLSVASTLNTPSFGTPTLAAFDSASGRRRKECKEDYCQRCPEREDSAKCPWIFKRYIPSELEAKWWEVTQKVGHKPCDAAESQFKEYFNRYKQAIKEGKMVPDKVEAYGGCSCEKSAEPVAFDPTVFSQFEYENACSKAVKYSYIEPLAGILRHPDSCPWKKFHWWPIVLRKDWLVVDQWEMHKNDVPDQKFYYFDAGASVWKKGAGGASQSWFEALYSNKCANFDGYWMWEVTAHAPEEIFRVLPDHVKPKYHWFNIPAAIDKANGDSPLYHIKSVANKEDWVMFKLDIDNNTVEEGIVKEMLADEELLSLVDEFFWEHHINMDPMTLAWKDTISKSATQKDSISFFRTMREHGIRAHSWV